MISAVPPDDAARQRKKLVDWFLRRHDGQWAPEDEQAFQKWMAASDNHRAYTQWEADWNSIDAMPQASADRLRAMVAADRQTRPTAQLTSALQPRLQGMVVPARRRTLAAGFAMAGIGGVAVASGWLGWRYVQSTPLYEQAFNTPKGQQSEATLPDGSTLRLDTATSLKTTYYRDRREIHLAEGQALFSVLPDAERPFRVIANDVVITVVGTRFSVRLTPDVPGRGGVEVVVQEGRVRISQKSLTQETRGSSSQKTREQTFELTAGQSLVFAVDGSPPRQGTVPAGGFASWRSARLSFSDVPLREALAEMDRYADLGISTVDPAAASLRLTGTFDLRDVAGTRKLLANALPIKLERGESGLELRSAR